jgi:aspartyl-tRNA(Asn)/glutamyl-tRNA(Gln) amidotransferase subunit A
MTDDDIHRLSVVEARTRIRSGTLSAVALLEACLRQIDRREPDIGAWVTLDRKGALETAQRLDDEARHGRFRGTLHGIPMGLKDIFHVAGLPTTAGARGFADTVPSHDAVAVERLRTAGAVILGKLQTSEFATADPTSTQNPWRLDRTPGGSSAGSAAAVAARMVPAALGSQTVGSTLRPAAFCGVVGFKPSYGSISRRGILPVSWSLDHVGLFIRTVADAGLLFSVLAASPVEEYSIHPTRRPRIGLVGSPFAHRTDPTMRDHLAIIGKRLASDGARIELVDLPEIVTALLAAVTVVMWAEVAAVHSDLHATHADQYRPKIRAAIEAGTCIPAPLYLRAQQVRRAARQTLVPLLQQFDACLMPAAAGPAPDPATTGDPSFNAPWSGIGAPQIALPTGLTLDGLPLGLQLIGAPGTETRLLATARWVEARIGFRETPPVV